MEKFDKHIKDQLADFEMQPPPGFWHTISDRLDQESIIETATASTFNYARILRIAAVFIGLFSLGTVSYLKYTPTPQPEVATLIPAKAIEYDAISSTTEIKATAPVIVNTKIATNVVPQKTKKTTAITPLEVTAKLIETKNTEPIAENKETTTTEFNLLESNIPVYSLKLLNKKVPSNDEITVIQSNKANTTTQTTPTKIGKKQPMPWRF